MFDVKMDNSQFCAGPNPGDYNSRIRQGRVSTESCLRTRIDYQRHLKSQPSSKTSITLSNYKHGDLKPLQNMNTSKMFACSRALIMTIIHSMHCMSFTLFFIVPCHYQPINSEK